MVTNNLQNAADIETMCYVVLAQKHMGDLPDSFNFNFFKNESEARNAFYRFSEHFNKEAKDIDDGDIINIEKEPVYCFETEDVYYKKYYIIGDDGKPNGKTIKHKINLFRITDKESIELATVFNC